MINIGYPLAQLMHQLNVTGGYLVTYIFPLRLFDALLLCSIMAALVLAVFYFAQLHLQEDENNEPILDITYRIIEPSQYRKWKKLEDSAIKLTIYISVCMLISNVV